jgi:hypothetical protein
VLSKEFSIRKDGRGIAGPFFLKIHVLSFYAITNIYRRELV